MAYIECDLDHKVPSIYDTLDIESKNTLDMTYIKGYSFPVQLDYFTSDTVVSHHNSILQQNQELGISCLAHNTKKTNILIFPA